MGIMSYNWSSDVRPIGQLARPGAPKVIPRHFVCDLVNGLDVCSICGRQFDSLTPPRPLFPREENLGDGDVCPVEWFIDGREPNNWLVQRAAFVAERNTVNRKHYVTLDAVKRFLKSDVSWDELQRSELLGIHPISGYTRLSASCSKGHALRDPKKKCKVCTKERVRKYREKRRN